MKQLFPLGMIAFVMTSAAWGGCALPVAPASIPDGKSSTKEEMMATKKEVDRYKKEVDAYLSCELNNSKQQVAQTQLERVASKFNNEVRAFKAANAGG